MGVLPSSPSPRPPHAVSPQLYLLLGFPPRITTLNVAREALPNLALPNSPLTTLPELEAPRCVLSLFFPHRIPCSA